MLTTRSSCTTSSCTRPDPNSSPNPHQVRWLGRHESPPREYIVATTHMCNGDAIVQSLVTSLENNLKHL